MLYIKWRSANQTQQYFKYWNCIKLSSFGIVGKKAQLALGNTQRSWFQLNLNLEISRAASKKNRNDKLWHHMVIDIYIYICIYNYCWKSPNSNHLYDHGFMDVINKYTNCQAVAKIDLVHKQVICPLFHGGSLHELRNISLVFGLSKFWQTLSIWYINIYIHLGQHWLRFGFRDIISWTYTVKSL